MFTQAQEREMAAWFLGWLAERGFIELEARGVTHMLVQVDADVWEQAEVTT